MPRPVLSKADMVRRYSAHEFGNRSPTWQTPGELVASQVDPKGKVHLRNRVAGGETFYNIEALEALIVWMAMPDPSRFYCSMMAPHEHNLLQGEVQDGPGGLYLHGTFERNLPMRDALAKSAYNWRGLQAKILLQQVMNDKSWEWFQYLLEAYPEHVIEFSAFNCCWGTRPAENVVWWEIRRY